MSEQSENINELAAALSKAQAHIGGAKKDSKNPFFKSDYADLESVWMACRKELTENELAVVQTNEPNPSGVTVVTTLVHSSGQWIRGRLNLNPTKADPQGIGSAITYGRRYALAAIAGVYQTDDDANQASTPQPTRNRSTANADFSQAVALLKCFDCQGEIDAYPFVDTHGQHQIVPLEKVRETNLRDFPDVSLCAKCQIMRHKLKREMESDLTPVLQASITQIEAKKRMEQAEKASNSFLDESVDPHRASGLVKAVRKPVGKGAMFVEIVSSNGTVASLSTFSKTLQKRLEESVNNAVILRYKLSDDGKYKNLTDVERVGQTDFTEGN